MTIPLDTAHKILATFGITKPSGEYQRWVKDEGFDEADFPSVLYESEYIFNLDWRSSLPDELERVVAGLNNLGVAISADASNDEETLSVTFDSRVTTLSFSPDDQLTSWRAVIQALQAIVPANIEFRESVNNGQSDEDVSEGRVARP